MWYAAAAAVAADYMAETALFVALVCFMLIADRPGGSLMETVSQCVTTIGIGPAVGWFTFLHFLEWSSRRGGISSNQIKQGLLLSLPVIFF